MFKVIIISINFLLMVCPVMAQEVSLSWDPSPSANISGYKIYYSQKNISTLPLDGYGAQEGDSPIDVGNTLGTTISALDDNGIYYFSVTAYDSEGNESTYSNVVSSGWIPALYEPANQTPAVTTPFVFSWESAPSGYDVSYILFYGTNKDRVTTAHVAPPLNRQSPPQTTPSSFPLPTNIFLISLLVVSALLLKYSSQNTYRLISGGILFGVLLTACTGGSSSSVSTDNSTVSVGAATATELTSIDMGSTASFQTTDLSPGVTYYWKIVAVDEVNTTLEYQSQVYSFTTAE